MSQLKKIVVGMCLLIACSRFANAQELFNYTEPASNMPAHSIGLRVSNWFMHEREGAATNYHLIPEVMWGVNKNLMLHAEGFLSNRGKAMSVEGGALYAKYRFYSKDVLHRHFRMAAFARLSMNNADVHMEEIETNGHNSGYELGLITTQLLHKQAMSATVSFEQAMDNAQNNEYPATQASRAINYTASTGRLILPREYKNYNQVNLNLMLEVLGQYHPEDGKSFFDVAPSVQLIFNSQARLDIGYKKQLYGNMRRTASDGVLLRFEYLLFNFLQ